MNRFPAVVHETVTARYADETLDFMTVPFARQDLATIKADPALQNIPLVTHSRLSVMPLDKAAFDRILALGKTKLR